MSPQQIDVCPGVLDNGPDLGLGPKVAWAIAPVPVDERRLIGAKMLLDDEALKVPNRQKVMACNSQSWKPDKPDLEART
jgi:hypothetical protein